MVASAGGTVHVVRPLTFGSRAMYLVVAATTFLFVSSLAIYFVEAWKKARHVSNRREYTLWVAFEAFFGIPFGLVCTLLGAASLWIALT